MMSQDTVFSPEGKLLALSHARTIYFFEVETGREIRKVSAELGMRPFAISPDGKHVALAAAVSKPIETRLASGGILTGQPAETRLAMVDLASGKETWTTPLPSEFYGQLAFSPDGKHLLVGMRHPTAKSES